MLLVAACVASLPARCQVADVRDCSSQLYRDSRACRERRRPINPPRRALYRYEVVELNMPILDGGLFACSAKESNDPEILLLIEARRKAGNVQWNYAPVRFTNRTTSLRYNGEEVWRAMGTVIGVFDGVNTKHYGVFEVKTIPDDKDR